jgi:hypothetical protein
MTRHTDVNIVQILAIQHIYRSDDVVIYLQLAMEQTWLDEDTALKAAARKGWGFESLLLRHFSICSLHLDSCRPLGFQHRADRADWKTEGKLDYLFEEASAFIMN